MNRCYACLLLLMVFPAVLWAQEESLEKIRDYQVYELNRSVNASSDQLAEVINVFPLRRGGIFHGSIYEYHRNDNLDARNFFDPAGRPLPEYKRNQFGASLGLRLGQRGNLLGAYDGTRINQGSTLLSHVPTAAMKQGDFSGLTNPGTGVLVDPLTGSWFPNNQIPASRIHPVAAIMLPLLPDPNRSDPSRNFVNNQPLVDDRDRVTGRFDLRASPRNRLALKYEWGKESGLRPHPLPAFGLQSQAFSQRAVLSWNQAISPAFIIDWNLDLERKREQRLTRLPRDAGLVDSLGIGGIEASDRLEEGYPEFRLAGYRAFGDEKSPEGSITNRVDLGAGFKNVKGSHSVQFGGSIGLNEINNHRSQGLRRGVFTFNGFYTGDSFADFLLGMADTASRARGVSRRDLRRKQTSLYLSDDWKISPRLTLSMGINYAYVSPFRSTRDDISVFHPFAFEPPSDGGLVILGSEQAQEIGKGGRDSRTPLRPDRNDWSPSLGIAYRPFDNNWLVVRSRYGLFHGTIPSNIFLNYSGRNHPFYFTESAHASQDGPALPLSSPFDNAVPSELSVWDIDPNLRNPRHHEWAFSLENEISEQWKLWVGYEGYKGTGVLRIVPGNVPLPEPGPIQARRPNSNFGGFWLATGGGMYSGHGLLLSGERRFSHGFSILASVDYRRIFSDADSLPQNPRHLRAERAPGAEPAAQLYLNFLVDLPFGANHRINLNAISWLNSVISGWRLSGVARAHSGYRMTVEMPGDANNDGITGDRPDRIGSAVLARSQRTIDQWFAIDHFVTPAPYAFGTSGRNILVGPGYRNLDLSLLRQVRFRTRHRLEFRFEMFNALNNVNFHIPDTWFGTSSFGKIFGAERAREIELALKYSF